MSKYNLEDILAESDSDESTVGTGPYEEVDINAILDEDDSDDVDDIDISKYLKPTSTKSAASTSMNGGQSGAKNAAADISLQSGKDSSSTNTATATSSSSSSLSSSSSGPNASQSAVKPAMSTSTQGQVGSGLRGIPETGVASSPSPPTRQHVSNAGTKSAVSRPSVLDLVQMDEAEDRAAADASQPHVSLSSFASTGTAANTSSTSSSSSSTSTSFYTSNTTQGSKPTQAAQPPVSSRPQAGPSSVVYEEKKQETPAPASSSTATSSDQKAGGVTGAQTPTQLKPKTGELKTAHDDADDAGSDDSDAHLNAVLNEVSSESDNDDTLHALGLGRPSPDKKDTGASAGTTTPAATTGKPSSSAKVDEHDDDDDEEEDEAAKKKTLEDILGEESSDDEEVEEILSGLSPKADVDAILKGLETSGGAAGGRTRSGSATRGGADSSALGQKKSDPIGITGSRRPTNKREELVSKILKEEGMLGTSVDSVDEQKRGREGDTDGGVSSADEAEEDLDIDAYITEKEVSASKLSEERQASLPSVKGVSNPLKRAEILEARMNTLGNYEMVAPLRAKREINKKRPAHNVVKLEMLSKLKFKLEEQRNNNQYGLPTATAICDRYIAIGTSRGVTLLFDHYQTLNHVFGKLSDAKDRGGVSSVALSLSSDVLYVGHETGQIAAWDINHKSLMKVVDDAFDSAVCCIRSTKSNKHAFVACDVIGRVTRLSLSKVFWSYSVDMQCLLEPNKKREAGRVCALSVLRANPGAPHPCDAYGLIAIANELITIIVALDPKPRILFRIPRTTADLQRPGTLPTLSWRPMQSRDKDRTSTSSSQRELELVTNPILTIARGRTIRLVQIVPVSAGQEDILKQTLPDGAERLSPSYLTLRSVGHMSLKKSQICGCEWLAGQVIIALTEKQDLRVIDPLDLCVLETIDVKNIGLIYHERYSNMETGAAEMSYISSFQVNVNDLLLVGLGAAAKTRVLSWSDRVNALRDQGKWIESLALALDFYDGCAKAAISLPRDDRALKAILGNRIVELLMNYVDVVMEPQIVQSRTISTLNKSGSGATTDLHTLKIIGGVAVDYCISIDRTDILFGDIYEKFCDANGGFVLLELIEPYILNGKLSHLNAEVLQDYIQHYASRGRLEQVEQSLLHMDIGCIDFQQVVRLCREHHLFSALIYVYNKGCDDYRTPIEEILRVIILLKEPHLIQKHGYKLLLYIEYCFSGKVFPSGDAIPAERQASLKASVVSLLFSKKPIVTEDSGSKTILKLPRTASGDRKSAYPKGVGNGSGASKDNGVGVQGGGGSDDAESTTYLWLRFLLDLDTKEFLRMLSILFDKRDWSIYCSSNKPVSSAPVTMSGTETSPAAPSTGPKGTKPPLPKTPAPPKKVEAKQPPPKAEAVGELFITKHVEGFVPTCQEIIDILLELMVDSSRDPFDVSADAAAQSPTGSEPTWSPKQLMQFYQFAGSYLATGTIRGSSDLVHRVFANLLIHNSDRLGLVDPAEVEAERLSREQTLLTLLERTDPNLYDSHNLIIKAESARYNKVCAFLYKQQRDFVRVLESYLRDPRKELRVEVFDYLHAVMRDTSLLPKEIDSLKLATIMRLPKLVETDPDRTARLIVESFADENERVLEVLQDYPKLQYRYLRSIMTSKRKDHSHHNNHQRPGSSPHHVDEHGASMAELLERSDMKLTSKMHEVFIELLCQFDPQYVYTHLKAHHDYNIDHILTMCRKYKINDASSYLLERTGDVQGALALTLQTVDERMHKLRLYVLSNHHKLANIASEDTPSSAVGRRRGSQVGLLALPQVQAVRDTISVATDLCERTVESESLWFTILDKFVSTQRSVKKEQDENLLQPVVAEMLQNALHSFVRMILERMMDYVGLQAIMRKITSDHEDDMFREFRGTIQGMLDTYNYEQNILKTANGLLASDMYRAVSLLVHKRSSALAPKTESCALCSHSLSDDTISSLMTLFPCGHSLHETCMPRGQDACPLCTRKTVHRREKKRGGKDDSSRDAPKPTKPEVSRSESRNDMRTKQYIMRLQMVERLKKKGSSYMTYSKLGHGGFGMMGSGGQKQLLNLAPDSNSDTKRIGRRMPGTLPSRPKYAGDITSN